MHKRAAHDLRDLVDQVAPTVESTIQTLTDKGTPVLDKGRKMARRKRKEMAATHRQVSTSLAERLPDPVVERLPIEARRKRGGMLKKLLLLAGLAGLGALVARKLTGRSGGGWQQSTYTPQPAPSPATTAGAAASAGTTTSAATGAHSGSAPQMGTEEPAAQPAADDQAAASPDEALADAVTEPHADTTPDNPVEVEQLDVSPPGEPGR